MKTHHEEPHAREGWSEKISSPVWWIVGVVALIALIGFALRPMMDRSGSAPALTIYTSQDQVYSQPLLERFTEETGIPVRAVYDSEAVKTVGLANRLLAERANPRADVFWNNEELRTRQLAREGVFEEDETWLEIGFRSRRLVVNTNLLAPEDYPSDFRELSRPEWRGRVALAYPLFGTTVTHFMAWRAEWGDDAWREWIRALAANDPLVVDGNSVVVQMIARGEAVVGMTDIDDIRAGQRRGEPVIELPISSDALLIPNTVARVKGGPNPDAAREFMRWIALPAVRRALVEMNAVEGGAEDRPAVATIRPDWPSLLQNLDDSAAELREVFLRD